LNYFSTCIAVANGSLLEKGVDLEQLVVIGGSLEVLDILSGLVETLQQYVHSTLKTAY